MRLQSNMRAEQMQVALLGASHAVERLHNQHKNLLVDSRILLQELADNVESTYSWLNTSQSQEETISGSMDKSIQKILAILSTGNQFGEELTKVLEVLHGESNNNEADLF
jgi:hypothetical protein